MSLLHGVTIENATGDIKDVYREVKEKRGMVPNGLQLFSVSPDTLKAQWENIKRIFTKTSEEQKLFQILRYLTATKNNSQYCIQASSKILIKKFELTQDELNIIKDTPSKVPLDKKHKALLIFAMKSLNLADYVNENDIIFLKNLGITEQEMFDIVKNASQMYVSHTLFKTFKVEIEKQIK